MPTPSVFSNGAWRLGKSGSVYANGAWHPIKSISVRANGVWRTDYFAPDPPTSISATVGGSCVGGVPQWSNPITVTGTPAGLQTRIYRRKVAVGQTPVLIATLAAGVSTYTDNVSGLTINQDYDYSAYSYDGVTESTTGVSTTINTGSPCP